MLTLGYLEFFPFVAFEQLSVQLLQFYELSVLILQAFFQLHQLAYVYLFSLPQLLVAFPKQLDLSLGMSLIFDNLRGRHSFCWLLEPFGLNRDISVVASGGGGRV